jgi:hypothetical protein
MRTAKPSVRRKYSAKGSIRVTLGEQHGRRWVGARSGASLLLDQDGGRLLLMLLGEEAVRVGWLQALGYLIANKAELIHLVAAVEPLPALASSRHDLFIPLLPGAQGLRRQAKHPRYCSDAVNAVGAVRIALHPSDPFRHESGLDPGRRSMRGQLKSKH